MAFDGKKLRNIRRANGFSQEKLALMCNVNKRTIQRAENGESIALETAAFIAEAVQMPTAALREVNAERIDVTNKSWDDVVLVPVVSGRRIVDLLRNSFEAEISFDVEPTHENIESLAQIAGLLEPFQPKPWEIPPERYNPSHSEVLEKQADVNAVLPSLSTMGITAYLATYTSQRRIPRYNMEEGQMYVTGKTPWEKVKIALLVFSDSSSSHLIRKPDDIFEDIFDANVEVPF